MFQLKNQFKMFYFCLIISIGLLLVINNNVMAFPKEESSSKKRDNSEIVKLEEENKKQKADIKRFFTTHKEFQGYSIEKNNKIIEILENPELIKILKQKAEEEGKSSQEKGSSSEQTDDSKK